MFFNVIVLQDIEDISPNGIWKGEVDRDAVNDVSIVVRPVIRRVASETDTPT